MFSKKIILSSLFLLLLFNIGYSAEASGTSVIAVFPVSPSNILIRDITAIPFKFYFTSTVTNASCIFYLKNPANAKASYDFNCTVYNNTLTTFYSNTTFTEEITEDWQWIVNCSVGCGDWSTWKDMDTWQNFSINTGQMSNKLGDLGTGTASLLDSLAGPMGSFMITFGIVMSVLGLIWSIISIIKLKITSI